ncbi:MAG: hypothetical protein NW218_03805 [Saprospiraceae bacterium]|nr:hypothetical protein [Saprospiraceae bacterium]
MATPSNHATNWRSLQIIFYALLAGQVIFFLVINYLKSTSIEPIFNLKLPLYLLQGMSVLLVFLGVGVFLNFMKDASLKPSFEEKFNAFRAASLAQWGLIEGATIIQMVDYYLTGSDVARGGVSVGLFLFFLRRPRKIELIYRLKLDSTEQQLLES